MALIRNQWTLSNGCNRPLDYRQGTVPDMSGAMRDWFQTLSFTQVTKTVVGFEVMEEAITTVFRGIIVPYGEQSLNLLPEGQRAWTHIQLFTDPVLTLIVDDVVTFLGKQTRVMGKSNYGIYDFVVFHLVQDWEGSEPTEAVVP